MFQTSNYNEDDKRTLPIDCNKKEIGFFKDELGGKIMKEFARLAAKTYSYLRDDVVSIEKVKEQKKVCNKKRAYV